MCAISPTTDEGSRRVEGIIFDSTKEKAHGRSAPILLTLLSVPGKVFSHALLAWLQLLLPNRQLPEQLGFNAGTSYNGIHTCPSSFIWNLLQIPLSIGCNRGRFQGRLCFSQQNCLMDFGIPDVSFLISIQESYNDLGAGI